MIMLDHCHYDKAKLLHELSCLMWFIERHAKTDAKQVDDKQFANLLEALSKELDKYITKIHENMCK